MDRNHTPWQKALAAVLATFVFTAFDVLVFPQAAEKRWLGWYRVLQSVVQISLYAGAWWLGGWTAALAAIVAWWLGACDVLFYWLGGHNWHTGTWPWLWWTPAGLWKWLPAFLRAPGTVLERAATGRESVTIDGCGVLWQAGIGALIAIIILIFMVIR